MNDKPTAPERVQASFRQLSAAATVLNSASDELGKTISELDGALLELNLGIAGWVMISGSGPDEDGDFWSRNIGYAKLNGQWGISLRTTSGNDRTEQESTECWTFNNAPRWLRIEGVGKIPDLLDKLIKQAEETAKRISQKSKEAKELAAAIKATVTDEKNGPRGKGTVFPSSGANSLQTLAKILAEGDKPAGGGR